MSELRKTYEGGVFFVTLALEGWIDVFIRPEYVEELLKNLQYCQREKGLRVYGYCIMSSHLHLIAAAETGKLSEILALFKSYTAKQLLHLIAHNPQESRREWMMQLFRQYGREDGKAYSFWQYTNHPVDLYSAPVMQQKLDYVHNNPVKAGMVARPEDYVYSSASPYRALAVLPL